MIKIYYDPRTDTIWEIGSVYIVPFKRELCGTSHWDVCWFLPEHLEPMIYLGEL